MQAHLSISQFCILFFKIFQYQNYLNPLPSLRPPYGDLEGVTHFFAELDKAPEKVDLEPFVARGIPCLKPIFINNYLIMDPLPEEEDHYISQYKDLLLSMR